MLNRLSPVSETNSFATGIASCLTTGFFTGLAIALSSTSTQAQSVNISQTKLNPCPGLYYEAPLNRRFLSPDGCPPNAARQNQQPQTEEPTTPPASQPTALPPIAPTTESFPTIPADSTAQPLPEELSPAIARVTPQSQKINVTLTNETQALITYEVIGETDLRILEGRETVVLRGLSVPSTISVVRNDSGLLNFVPTVDEAGQLQISLDENPQFNEVQGVLQIQEDGEVFLN